MPAGVPNIIGNEAAERFSFYGMRAILAVFMTTYLMNAAGQRAVMGEDEASGWFHQFVAAVYWMPIFGALISDGLLGKYRTIFYLSIVYCLGHLSLALNDTRLGLFLGLSLIAIGAGGIKPCVSANVGDQFGRGNQHLMSKVFGWFYLSINLGSTFSTWLCPILLNNPNFGPHYAFGLPGVLMFIAAVVFWLGRKKFVHVPPGGFGFVREFFSKEGLAVLLRLAFVYLFVSVYLKPDPDLNPGASLQLRVLSGNRSHFSAYATAQDRHRSLRYGAVVRRPLVDSTAARRWSEAERSLAATWVHSAYGWRSDGIDYRSRILLHPSSKKDEERSDGPLAFRGQRRESHYVGHRFQ